jgi:hypothetical protein
MAFYYTSLITDEISRLKLVNFGDEVAKLVSEHNNNSSSRIHLILHGTTVAGAEVQRSASETMKLSVGCKSLFLCSLLFIFFSFARCFLVFLALSYIFIVDARKTCVQAIVFQYFGTFFASFGISKRVWTIVFNWRSN